MSEPGISYTVIATEDTENGICPVSFPNLSYATEYSDQAAYEEDNIENCTEYVTVPSTDLVTNDGKPYIYEDIEAYQCRTCLNTVDEATSASMTDTFFFEKTIKEVIVFLVPEMDSKLLDDEVVCSDCLNVLDTTMQFILKCLEVETILSKQKENVTGESDDGDLVDEEHDYCVKDIVNTESDADVNENTCVFEQVISDGNVENDIEIEYKYQPTTVEMEKSSCVVGKKELYKGKPNVREKEIFSCPICLESFTVKEDYKSHLDIHPAHVCDICNKSFLKKDSLRAHKLIHNDTNRFICEICGKGFRDYGGLRGHLKNHENGDIFICEKCSKVFKTKRILDIHIKYVHNKLYKTQCTICGILSRNEASLHTHMRLVHFKEKPYECNICHKKFGRADYLHNHELRHLAEEQRASKPQPEETKVLRRRRLRYKTQNTGEPLPCKFCGQWYKGVVKLKRHLETHLKRFQCQFCPLTFPRKVLCKKHEEIHRGGTVNFVRCNVCWKKFKTKEALDEHAACHNNPQHFCDMCGKTFNRKFLLSHHKLMEHSNIQDKEEPEEIIYDSLLEVGVLSM